MSEARSRRRTEISIHASAREATDGREPMEVEDEFQSTPPRGRRLSARFILAETTNFNPRLREGGDAECWELSEREKISIHASAREATALITNFYI